MKRPCVGFLCLVASMLAVGQVQADTITIGDLGLAGGNAFPFGGYLIPPGTRYQQVYNASLFSGPISISAITFFHSDSGSVLSSTYSIDLSTTTKPVNGLDTVNLNNNVGVNNQAFSSNFLNSNPGSTLTFTGTPFLYDPSQGNLLMDISVSPGGTAFTTFFAAMNGNFGTDSSRAHNFGTGFEGFGLVTQFTFSPVAVPEPGTLLVLGVGLVGLAGYGRRRRKTARA